jgi:hypothetical protein
VVAGRAGPAAATPRRDGLPESGPARDVAGMTHCRDLFLELPGSGHGMHEVMSDE